MDNAKHCNPERFKVLQKKSFSTFFTGLLGKVLEELPDYVAVVYLEIYKLVQENSIYPGTIIISYAALGKKLKKSDASIKRAMKVLKERGYLKVTSQVSCSKGPLPNIIEPLCPKEVLLELDKFYKEKETTIEKNKIENERSEDPAVINEDRLEDELQKMKSIYEQHQINVEHFKSKGYNPRQANEEAFKALELEIANKLKEHLDKLAMKKYWEKTRGVGSNLTPGGGITNDLHKNNNNVDVIMLTIDNMLNPEELATKIADLRLETIVNFEKEKNFVKQPLSLFDSKMIENKLQAMYKSNEIHSSLRSIELKQLIAEVKYHVMNRNENITPTVRHSLNAAAVMLRNGKWATPKKLQVLCSKRVEKALELLKQKEILNTKVQYKKIIE
jgi:hypothetical protein